MLHYALHETWDSFENVTGSMTRCRHTGVFGVALSPASGYQPRVSDSSNSACQILTFPDRHKNKNISVSSVGIKDALTGRCSPLSLSA